MTNGNLDDFWTLKAVPLPWAHLKLLPVDSWHLCVLFLCLTSSVFFSVVFAAVVIWLLSSVDEILSCIPTDCVAHWDRRASNRQTQCVKIPPNVSHVLLDICLCFYSRDGSVFHFCELYNRCFWATVFPTIVLLSEMVEIWALVMCVYLLIILMQAGVVHTFFHIHLPPGPLMMSFCELLGFFIFYFILTSL